MSTATLTITDLDVSTFLGEIEALLRRSAAQPVVDPLVARCQDVFTVVDGAVIRKRTGKPVGSPSGRRGNYAQVRLDGVSHYLGPVAWMTQTGTPVPDDAEVDHIAGNPMTNNAIENLQIVTPIQNLDLRALRSNPNGIGVFATSKGRPWQSALCRNRSQKYLGSFDTRGEAFAAYDAARRELDPAWWDGLRSLWLYPNVKVPSQAVYLEMLGL